MFKHTINMIDTGIEVMVDEGVDTPCSFAMIEKVVKTSCAIAQGIRQPVLCVRFAADADVRALNARWRNQDKVTDVLSFPMQEGDIDESQPLGDIVLAMPFVAREAQRLGLHIDAHSYHLIAHGTLHLLGYDHMEDKQAEQMQQLEHTIMARLGLHAPYPVTAA